MSPIFLIHGIFPAYAGFEEGFNPSEIPEDTAYVLDGTGWKLWKRNGVSTALIPVKSVSGLKKLDESIQFTAQKIPLELVRKVTAWFSAVYRKHQSEAVGYLLYCPETGEWDFVVPTQTVGPASCSYEQAPKRDGWQVAGTIHSHGNMSAFHSGVDDADEEFFDGVHITIGKVDGAGVPEYACSIIAGGVRESVDPSVVIDGMAPVDEIPTEWLSAVKENRPHLVFFQKEADALWERYYASELSEVQYRTEFKKLKKREESRRASARLADGRGHQVGEFDTLTTPQFGGINVTPAGGKPRKRGKSKRRARS